MMTRSVFQQPWPWFRVAALFVAALFLIFHPVAPRLDYAIDLRVYAEAGAKALAHQSPYDATVYYQYKYSPMIALGMGAFFHWIPMPMAIGVHFYSFLFLWIVWILWIPRLLKTENLIPESWAPFLPGLFFVFFASPWVEELQIGQINALPLLLMTAFFVGLKRWRPVWTGLLFALAVCFKLYVLLAVPYLLFQRRRQELQILAWSGLWALGLNLVIVGLYSGFEFAAQDFMTWLVNLKSSSADLVPFRYNASLLGVFSKAFGVGFSATALWLSVTGVFVFFQWRLRDQHPLVNLSWILGGVIILNPLVWSYWVPFLFPMVALAAAPRAWSHRGAAIGFLVMAGIFQMHHSYFNRDLGLQVAALVLAFVFLKQRLSKARPI